MSYQIGSDKKIVAIAKLTVIIVNNFLKNGDFTSADKTIDSLAGSDNASLFMEFLHQVEIDASAAALQWEIQA